MGMKALSKKIATAVTELDVTEPQQEAAASTRKQAENSKPKRQPPYNVILWDDDDHSYEYVIEMLQKLFGYPTVKGFQLAQEVDLSGRVICLTTTLEHAELKRDQIHAYGKDNIEGSLGSMWATIEPVE